MDGQAREGWCVGRHADQLSRGAGLALQSSAFWISRSGTRKEELITDPQLLKKMYVLRRILNPMGTMDAIDFLLDKLRNTKNNSEFFKSMNT